MIIVLSVLAASALAAMLLLRRVALRADAAERRLRRLVSLGPDTAAGLVDPAGKVVLLAGAELESSAWPTRELVGRSLGDLAEGDARERLLAAVAAALEGRASQLELESERSPAVYRIDVAPFEEAGAISHAALTVRDIGPEVALRRSLEKQRVFLRAVLNELGERVRVADAEGRLHAFDGSEVDDDLHPLEWAEHFGLHHPDGTALGPHETPLLRALRGEPVRGVEIHVQTAAGPRTLLETGGPVFGPDGERLGAVVVNADLTDFRDAEVRLRASEERHRRVIESVSECVFETDAQGRWTYLTQAWADTTGHPVEATLGRPVSCFVHPSDRAEHARAFAPLMGGERAALRHSHRFLTADGALRWAEVQVRAISGWDGLPTGFVGVMRDVTDDVRAKQHTVAERNVTRRLTGMDRLDDAGPVLLEILGAELGWDGAELWRMGDDERLRRSASWTAPGVALPAFMGAGERLAHEVGDGLPGMAWMSRDPLWVNELARERAPVRALEARADGVCAMVALPLRAGDAPEGVVVLVSRAPRQPEAGLARLLEAIGGQITQFRQRREAESRAVAQAEDLRTLSRVAHELATQDDLFAARTTLCRAVRDVTGSDSVALLEPTGRGALAVSATIGAAVLGLELDVEGRAVTAEAYLTGELIFVEEVLADARAASCPAVAGAVSAAWVPVLRDGEAVGVLAVGWDDRHPALTARDVELLRLLAAEAAITIHRTDLVARLQATARTDPLTGLPNRRVWDEDLERELVRARRHGGSLCLAMLDLDRFKAYNDRFGHQAGDELLAAAAAAWRLELRATDTLARYGGEEFAALLPHSDLAAARSVVERLLAVVPAGQTASAGIAVWDGEETAAALLARADAALYGAKDAGRARALLAA